MTTHIKISSEKIKELAANRLNNIKIYKEQITEELIVKKRKKICSGFLFKLFKKAVPTDDQIVKMWGDERDWSPIDIVNMNYSLEESTLKKLLHIAELTDEISVSMEDALYLR